MKRMLMFLSVTWLLAACGATPSPGLSGATDATRGSEQNRARIHTELGAGYFARGQYGVALSELKEALAAEASYAPAYNILGLVRGELGEDKEAEDAYRRAIALQPQYSEALNNYALFLCHRGRTEEALSRFEAALANPLYATPETALANAGVCSLGKADVTQAERYFARALRRAPDQPLALLGMAEVEYRTGRLLAARGKLKQLANLTELNAQALWLGVRVERSLGDHAAENSFATQLKRRYPEALQTQWLMMGQYDQTGELL
ncbi:MAG TPA: type IV pilus biogenesis/stability protein PilW [Thiobacillaceae bacterium]|nr:type IV pilus biogenesis/stability protein PilW [Thiobacillaceae bacterium]HNU63357.1 type IV pilus biogenesis/stability protein PilW [Thiobacillaceae bacterium]